MGLNGKVFKDKEGFARFNIVGNKQRIIDIIYRLKHGWTENEVISDREITMGEIFTAREYYLQNKDEIDAQMFEVYDNWEEPLQVPADCNPITEKGRIIGYKSKQPIKRPKSI